MGSPHRHLLFDPKQKSKPYAFFLSGLGPPRMVSHFLAPSTSRIDILDLLASLQDDLSYEMPVDGSLLYYGGPGEGRLVASLEDGRFKPAIPSGSLIITLSDINVAGIPLYIEEPESSLPRQDSLDWDILSDDTSDNVEAPLSLPDILNTLKTCLELELPRSDQTIRSVTGGQQSVLAKLICMNPPWETVSTNYSHLRRQIEDALPNLGSGSPYAGFAMPCASEFITWVYYAHLWYSSHPSVWEPVLDHPWPGWRAFIERLDKF